jgi:hypothetical protein
MHTDERELWPRDDRAEQMHEDRESEECQPPRGLDVGEPGEKEPPEQTGQHLHR